MCLFFRNGAVLQYGRAVRASTSQPITVCHFTGSDACNVINNINYVLTLNTFEVVNDCYTSSSSVHHFDRSQQTSSCLLKTLRHS